MEGARRRRERQQRRATVKMSQRKGGWSKRERESASDWRFGRRDQERAKNRRQEQFSISCPSATPGQRRREEEKAPSVTTSCSFKYTPATRLNCGFSSRLQIVLPHASGAAQSDRRAGSCLYLSRCEVCGPFVRGEQEGIDGWRAVSGPGRQ